MYHLTSHLRLNAVYWGLTAVTIMKHPDALDRTDLIDFVMKCWDQKTGAFGAHPRHDAHILPTLSGIQILVILDALHVLDDASDGGPSYKSRIINFILSLQHPSAKSFSGDRFGETDTRFCYCAVSALSLLGALNKLDIDGTAAYIRQCKNFDGGYGSDVGGESHASQVFTCLGALAILDRVEEVDAETLAWWLAERQLPNGGLNGRPEKLEDVCYSFWVLSSLSILSRISWIDAPALEQFILSAQDTDTGGIADRPGDMADVWHTVFGVAGLSLLGYPELDDLDPVYCMPSTVIERRGLRKAWTALPRRAAAEKA